MRLPVTLEERRVPVSLIKRLDILVPRATRIFGELFALPSPGKGQSGGSVGPGKY